MPLISLNIMKERNVGPAANVKRFACTNLFLLLFTYSSIQLRFDVFCGTLSYNYLSAHYTTPTN